jgi:hypothetical protein
MSEDNIKQLSEAVFGMAADLERDGRQIDELVERLTINNADWDKLSTELSRQFYTTRKRFPSNIEFGEWLAKTGRDYFNKDDRAALINLGENLEIARRIFAETTSRSYQRIWLEERHRLLSAKKTDPDPSSSAIMPESPPQPPQTQQMPLPESPKAHTSSPPKIARPIPTGRLSILEKNHGTAGETVFCWLLAQRGTMGTDYGMKAAAMLAALKTTTIKEVARFVASQPDLRASIHLDKPGPRIFWREMPDGLVRLFERGVPTKNGVPQPDPIILATINQWNNLAVPVLSAWLSAGQPPAGKWYPEFARARAPSPSPAPLPPPTPGAPPDMSHVPPHMKALLNPDRGYESDHPGFRISHEGPIKAYGAQLWPRPDGARWSYRDAFYAFHLWRCLDQSLAVKEPRPQVRARELMNPFFPILTNINGAVGAVMNEILGAQHYHPEKESETQAPPKRLNIARE